MRRWTGEGQRRTGDRGGHGTAAEAAKTGVACARGAGDAPCVHYWVIREDWVQECVRCGASEPVARPGFGQPRRLRDPQHPAVKGGHWLVDIRARGLVVPCRSTFVEW